MKKRYIVAAGVLGSIAAGAMLYKKAKSKSDNILLYPICRITMHDKLTVYTLDRMVKKSEAIIIGTVEDKSEPKWNNKDNIQPSNITNKDVIYVDYSVKVEQVLKSKVTPEDSIKIRSFAGELGGFTIEDNSQPILKSGQKVLAFLTKDDTSFNRHKEDNHFIPLGGITGIFILNEDKLMYDNKEYEISQFKEEIKKY